MVTLKVTILYYGLQISQDQPCSLCKTVNSINGLISNFLQRPTSRSHAGKHTTPLASVPVYCFSSWCHTSLHCRVFLGSLGRAARPALPITASPPGQYALPMCPETLQLRRVGHDHRGNYNSQSAAPTAAFYKPTTKKNTSTTPE